MTLELHQVLPLPRKVTLELHQVLCLSRKVTLDLHQVLRLYCACHTEWLARLILVTYETSFTMRGATYVTLKLTKYRACHARWPPNIWQKFDENSWNVISNARPIRDRSDHEPVSPQHAAQQRLLFALRTSIFLLKNTTFRAPAIFPNFTKYCACHEKWHLNFTKYCACHEKWHLNFTNYCACHEKWHLTFTKYCACHEKCHLTFT